LGEYAFAYLLIAGCRNSGSNKSITVRSGLWLIPAVSTAFFLAFSTGDFNEGFNFHSFIMGISFVVAFFALKPSSEFSKDNFGWRAMRVALALLALDFFHYTILYSLRHTSYPQMLGEYTTFNSVIDLVIEILLGFGMVIVLLEKVRVDVEETNHKLKEAHDKLERLANVDPLTTAFTRHAFYSFLQKHNRENSTVSGCVGVFDIDNLKPINDRYGHAVGDTAISSTAHAIRSLVRADDLIFRWGGDEFFVVMLGYETEQAIDRMCELNLLLTDIKLFGAVERISIGVSFGFADFSDIVDLENSIKQADAEMYRAKQQNKCSDKTEKTSYYLPTEISRETAIKI
jgi:diguanylate cyclase (GGDEF)-like protein